MRARIAACSMLCALLTLTGCGVVEETARSVLGDTIAGLVGLAPASGEDAGPDGAAARGREGLSIAADEDAADAVADERDEPQGEGFYKVVEPNGTVRFVSNLSEVPVSQRGDAERLALAPSRSHSKQPPRRTAPARAKQVTAAQPDAPPAAIASAGSHEVVIYTTSWCGWCNKARAWLDSKGVDYVNKDVERDDDAASEMRELTGGEGGVPVVVIDGQVIRGFDQARMRKLLRI